MAASTAPEKLLDQAAAADILGVRECTLEQWRSRRQGPPFVKVGKLARYKSSALASWIEKQTITPVAA